MHINLSPLDKEKLGGSNENEQNQVDIECQDGFTGRMRKFRTDKAERRISFAKAGGGTLESSLSLNSTDSCFSWGSWTGVVRISGLSLFSKVPTAKHFFCNFKKITSSLQGMFRSKKSQSEMQTIPFNKNSGSLRASSVSPEP